MGFVARVTLLGAVAGLLVASAAVWVAETWIAEVVLRQVTARASDHVRMAVLTQVSPDDFVTPHTPAKLAGLAARLTPVLSGLRHDGSGLLGVNLVAPDGMVLYSDVDADAELRLHHDSALHVYVPVVLGGHVVGAYGVYHDLAPLRSARPVVLVTIAGVFGTLVHLGIRTRVSGRADPAPRRKRVARATAEPPQVCLSARAEWHSLTARELEVLKLMATSHTYREIAARLGVSEETVRSHVKRILHKLGQPDRTQAVVAALRAGVLQLP